MIPNGFNLCLIFLHPINDPSNIQALLQSGRFELLVCIFLFRTSQPESPTVNILFKFYNMMVYICNDDPRYFMAFWLIMAT